MRFWGVGDVWGVVVAVVKTGCLWRGVHWISSLVSGGVGDGDVNARCLSGDSLVFKSKLNLILLSLGI